MGHNLEFREVRKTLADGIKKWVTELRKVGKIVG
jgi:hypothetical protein